MIRIWTIARYAGLALSINQEFTSGNDQDSATKGTLQHSSSYLWT